MFYATYEHIDHHHGGQDSFWDTLLRGFAWRAGGDAANTVFHLAPGLITALIVVGALLTALRWLLRR